MLENADWAERVEEKLDAILAAVHSQDLRLTKAETQIGFAKWLGGIAGTVSVAIFGWIFNNTDKFNK